MTPSEFAAALLKYCDRTHGSVTSYLRTPAHNATVGGTAGSPHVHGVGADVVYDASRLDAATREQIAAGLGLMIVHENDHDHLQPIAWQNHP